MQRMNLFLYMSALLFLLLSVSCSVISRQVREQSLRSVSFPNLLHNSNEYSGKTVIVGGYILATESKADETIIHVIQAPLTLMDNPGLKDKSEGRFVVVHKGWLDPEIYSKDRLLTVAGTIIGLLREETGQCLSGCLKLESREMYLWPKYDNRDYFFYDDPFYYHREYPFSRYPYQRYPYFGHRPPYYY